jgi:hypothetical protein
MCLDRSVLHLADFKNMAKMIAHWSGSVFSRPLHASMPLELGVSLAAENLANTSPLAGMCLSAIHSCA